jgi:hypothetical protein
MRDGDDHVQAEASEVRVDRGKQLAPELWPVELAVEYDQRESRILARDNSDLFEVVVHARRMREDRRLAVVDTELVPVRIPLDVRLDRVRAARERLLHVGDPVRIVRDDVERTAAFVGHVVPIVTRKRSSRWSSISSIGAASIAHDSQLNSDGRRSSTAIT